MFCPRCGTGISDEARYCPSCGAAVGEGTAPQPVPSVPMAPLPTYLPPSPRPVPATSPLEPLADAPAKTSGMAIAGLVCSILCGILGLILSIAALSEIRNSKGRVTGDGIATAGIVISVINMFVGLLMALA